MDEFQPFSTQPVGVDPTGDFLNNALNQMSQTYNKTLSNNKVQYGDISVLDPFQYQENYNPLFFNPVDSANNYSRYAELENIGSTLSKSFDDFGYKFKNSYAEYFKSYYRLGKSILTADLSHLDPTEDQLMKGYYDDHINEMKNKVFMTAEEEDNFFNKQFLKDFLGNAGFTLGTFAAFSTELAFDLALEALSGGSATPLIAGRLGKVLSDFGTGFAMSSRSVDDIVRLRKTLSLDDASQVSQMSKLRLSKDYGSVLREHMRAISIDLKDINKTKTLHGKFIKTLEELPVLGSTVRSLSKLDKAGDAMTGMQKAGLTFGGFKRSLAEFNLASSEAAFESVHTYGGTLDRMIREYEDKHGKPPQGADLTQMKTLAMEAATGNYATNTAILLLSNKIQFGNLMSKFAPTKKLMQDFTEEGASRVLEVSGKNAAGEFVRKLYDQKGLVKAFKNVGDMSKTFGKGIATKELGKALVRSGLQFEVTEGLQELLQETSNIAWEEYYSNMYSRDPISMMKSINLGLEDQMSEQGFKTFLIGAFTGSITRPVTNLAQMGATKLSDLKYKNQSNNPRVQYEKQFKNDLFLANQSLRKDYFNENIFNFKVQQEASAGMTSAAANNNIYEYKNHQANALIAAVKAHKRLNTLDTYVSNLRQLGEQFTDQEFEEAFKIKPSDTKYGTAAVMFNSMADDMENYSKVYDNVKNNLPVVLDPSSLESDNRMRIAQILYSNILNDAADVIAFNTIKSQDSIKRMQSLANDIMSIPGMSQSSDFVTRILTSSENINSHLSLLESEIANLEKVEQKDKATKELLKSKKQELVLLDQWSALMDNKYEDKEVNVEQPDGTVVKKKTKVLTDWQIDQATFKEDKTSKLLQKIVNLKNKQLNFNSELTDTNSLDLVNKLVDYINLDTDSKSYLKTIDALTNPTQFKKMLVNMLDGKFKALVGIAIDKIHQDLTLGVIQGSFTIEEYSDLLKDPLLVKLETLYYSNEIGHEVYESIDQYVKEFYEKHKEKLNHVPTDTTSSNTQTPTTTPTEENPPVAPPVVTPPPAPTAPSTPAISKEEEKKLEAELPEETRETVNKVEIPAKYASLYGIELVNKLIEDDVDLQEQRNLYTTDQIPGLSIVPDPGASTGSRSCGTAPRR